MRSLNKNGKDGLVQRTSLSFIPGRLAGDSSFFRSNLVPDGKAAHNAVDLDLDLFPNLGPRYEDNETLNPGDAVPFTSDIFDLHIIFSTDGHRGSGSRTMHRRRTFLTSEQIFTVLGQKPSPEFCASLSFQLNY